MLDGRCGVPVPLDDHALGLIVVEVGVELQRSAVLGPHDLHGLSGQSLVLLDLALVELEASDAYNLTHGSGLHSALLGSSARLSGRTPIPRITTGRRLGNRPAARSRSPRRVAAAGVFSMQPAHDFTGAADIPGKMAIVAATTPLSLRDIAPHVPAYIAHFETLSADALQIEPSRLPLEVLF